MNFIKNILFCFLIVEGVHGFSFFPVVRWGVTAGPLASIGLIALLKNTLINKTGKSIDPTIEEFVRMEASKIGFSQNALDDLGVKVLPLGGFQPATAGTNTIAISKNFTGHLHQLLVTRDRSNEDNEALDTYRACIQHEAAHIKNNDLKKFALCSFIMPFVTSVIFKGLSMKCGHMIPFINAWPKTRTIVGIIGELSVNIMAFCAYSKYREQEADNAIQNDISVLKAFENFHKKLIPFISFHPTHPTPKQRAEKLSERIKVLEQKNNNK